LIGGYAVGFHGHVRATADMDVWVERSPENAARVVRALREFGFASANPSPEFFVQKRKVARMGVPPMRIEVLTSISGVEFAECYSRKCSAVIDGVDVQVIGLEDLRANKKASGRTKDLADFEELA
jgi:hypothetical protein